MAKGTVDTTGTLAPELKPLFSDSVQRMLGVQAAAPVTDYLGRNVQRTVPLSQSEREGIGLARGMQNPSGIEALTLQQILRMPGLAGAGPGTGVASTKTPDIRDLLAALQNPSTPAPASTYRPAPFGPDPRDPYPFGPPGGPPGGPRPGGVGGGGDTGGTGTGGGRIKPLGMQTLGQPGVGLLGPPITDGGTLPPGAPRPALPPLGSPSVATPAGARDTSAIGPRIGGPPPVWDPMGLEAAAGSGDSSPSTSTRMPPAVGGLPPRPTPIGVPPRGSPPGTPPPPGSLPPPPRPFPGTPPGDRYRPPDTTGDPNALPDMPPAQGPNLRELGALQDFSTEGPAPDNNYAFFDQSPVIKAAMKSFEGNALPSIQNQMNLSGLGRSTAAGDAIAKAQGQMMTPLLQSELDRQERAAVRTSDATQQQIQDLLSLTSGEQGRQTGAVNTLMQTGGVQRGVGQSAEDAAYNDFLRRQALSEQGTFLPFGQAMPSALGSHQISSGGLFK